MGDVAAKGPTKADRRRVEVAAGGGMPHQEIADALGVTVAELRRAYEWELSVGAHRRRLDVMQGLYREAKGGNVSAAKAYMANQVRAAAPPLPESLKPSPVEKLGKKAQRNEDAKTAADGTEWEDLLPRPGLAN